MIRIDRRQLILTSGLGLGSLMLPGGTAAAQAFWTARGFTHSVASGEPDQDSMLLWTRWVGRGDAPQAVRAEMSETADFARVVAGGVANTGPYRDWTVKITCDGLKPGTSYFYRFIAPDGAISPIGRTKTLPAEGARRFGIAVFSCSNLPFGFFNAYAHAAARPDIDMWVHLGDYMYEYGRGTYPSENEAMKDRLLEPVGETITLVDYRLRYASYRADPDLQALHAMKPMWTSADDHESTNDSWEGGAQNHQSATEGTWDVRKAAALQVWYEWMPVSEVPYRSYQVGDLATLFRTESRIVARTEEASYADAAFSADAAAKLKEFRDGPLQDPARTMLGTTQEAWLAKGLRTSVRARTKWQVVGFGTIMGEQYFPEAALALLSPDTSEGSRRWVQAGVAAGKAGVPYNLDNWGGYPKARARFLSAVQNAGANAVVICGDSHNGWAYDLKNDGRAAAVEFCGQSVTSPGFENATKGSDPKRVAAALMSASPELRWCDTSRRGYMALTLTPEAATNEWVFMDTIKARSTATQASNRMRVRPGRAVLETV